MSNFNLGDVSRETIERLHEFESLVLKWTKKINLISSGDAAQLWDRHIVDSTQIYALAPNVGDWLDIGSGGGFPGIVVAVLARELAPERQFTLVDSDQRKCAFLRTAARELNLKVKVLAERVDKIPSFNTPVLSARALGDLNSLLGYAEIHLAQDGIALFPKGANWEKEHEEAMNTWSYDIEVITSETNPDATILKIRELTRV
ncbi:16S rRNA (guanine527-N7)-methyltransferase [Sulfitobacter undariae]|uniref:Ribosomal RNA small subunit methyltransferase G n=1 Tax=Sulfitobacter undariae TaxID=1563671 RepID=A0A7W6E3L4_9RHOB|nr:16S rRNA (guanine(527)-N(7))-methyltransferase RsmG [Sulfitobacter undariae]MBB3994132.1 16S rRNA (guanine527-N7)-methyltransferase [Sulfitobacter undariae]